MSNNLSLKDAVSSFLSAVEEPETDLRAQVNDFVIKATGQDPEWWEDGYKEPGKPQPPIADELKIDGPNSHAGPSITTAARLFYGLGHIPGDPEQDTEGMDTYANTEDAPHIHVTRCAADGCKAKYEIGRQRDDISGVNERWVRGSGLTERHGDVMPEDMNPEQGKAYVERQADLWGHDTNTSGWRHTLDHPSVQVHATTCNGCNRTIMMHHFSNENELAGVHPHGEAFRDHCDAKPPPTYKGTQADILKGQQPGTFQSRVTQKTLSPRELEHHLTKAYRDAGMTDADIDHVIREHYVPEHMDYQPLTKGLAATHTACVNDQFIHSFANDSPHNVAMHRIFADKYNHPGWKERPSHIDNYTWDGSHRWYNDPDWYKAVSAFYDGQKAATAARFKKLGVSHVDLYRGEYAPPDEDTKREIDRRYEENPRGVLVHRSGYKHLKGMSSFAGSPRDAVEFGGHTGETSAWSEPEERKYSTITAIHMPVHHIVGSYHTGFGEPFQSEYIVNGGKYPAHFYHSTNKDKIKRTISRSPHPTTKEPANAVLDSIKQAHADVMKAYKLNAEGMVERDRPALHHNVGLGINPPSEMRHFYMPQDPWAAKGVLPDVTKVVRNPNKNPGVWMSQQVNDLGLHKAVPPMELGPGEEEMWHTTGDWPHSHADDGQPAREGDILHMYPTQPIGDNDPGIYWSKKPTLAYAGGERARFMNEEKPTHVAYLNDPDQLHRPIYLIRQKQVAPGWRTNNMGEKEASINQYMQMRVTKRHEVDHPMFRGTPDAHTRKVIVLDTERVPYGQHVPPKNPPPHIVHQGHPDYNRLAGGGRRIGFNKKAADAELVKWGKPNYGDKELRAKIPPMEGTPGKRDSELWHTTGDWLDHHEDGNPIQAGDVFHMYPTRPVGDNFPGVYWSQKPSVGYAGGERERFDAMMSRQKTYLTHPNHQNRPVYLIRHRQADVNWRPSAQDDSDETSFNKVMPMRVLKRHEINHTVFPGTRQAHQRRVVVLDTEYAPHLGTGHARPAPSNIMHVGHPNYWDAVNGPKAPPKPTQAPNQAPNQAPKPAPAAPRPQAGRPVLRRLFGKAAGSIGEHAVNWDLNDDEYGRDVNQAHDMDGLHTGDHEHFDEPEEGVTYFPARGWEDEQVEKAVGVSAKPFKVDSNKVPLPPVPHDVESWGGDFVPPPSAHKYDPHPGAPHIRTVPPSALADTPIPEDEESEHNDWDPLNHYTSDWAMDARPGDTLGLKALKPPHPYAAPGVYFSHEHLSKYAGTESSRGAYLSNPKYKHRPIVNIRVKLHPDIYPARGNTLDETEVRVPHDLKVRVHSRVDGVRTIYDRDNPKKNHLRHHITLHCHVMPFEENTEKAAGYSRRVEHPYENLNPTRRQTRPDAPESSKLDWTPHADAAARYLEQPGRYWPKGYFGKETYEHAFSDMGDFGHPLPTDEYNAHFISKKFKGATPEECHAVHTALFPEGSQSFEGDDLHPAARIMYDLEQQWTQGGASQHPANNAFQHVVNKHFNCGAWKTRPEWAHPTAYDEGFRLAQHPLVHKVLSSLANTMYKHTQDALLRRNIHEVRLSRGTNAVGGMIAPVQDAINRHQGDTGNWVDHGVVNVEGNPLSSWSTGPSYAHAFGGHINAEKENEAGIERKAPVSAETNPPVTLTTTMPRSRILWYGPGFADHSAAEAIVLHGPTPAHFVVSHHSPGPTKPYVSKDFFNSAREKPHPFANILHHHFYNKPMDKQLSWTAD